MATYWDSAAGYNISELDPDSPKSLSRRYVCNLLEINYAYRETHEEHVPRAMHVVPIHPIKETNFDSVVERVLTAIRAHRRIYQCSPDSDNMIDYWILHMELTMLSVLQKIYNNMDKPPEHHTLLGGLHSPFIEANSDTFIYSYAGRNNPYVQLLARARGVI